MARRFLNGAWQSLFMRSRLTAFLVSFLKKRKKRTLPSRAYFILPLIEVSETMESFPWMRAITAALLRAELPRISWRTLAWFQSNNVIIATATRWKFLAVVQAARLRALRTETITVNPPPYLGWRRNLLWGFEKWLCVKSRYEGKFLLIFLCLFLAFKWQEWFHNSFNHSDSICLCALRIVCAHASMFV